MDDLTTEDVYEHPAYRGIGNAFPPLWDIPKESLTKQEHNRLNTILKKMKELSNMIEDRVDSQ